MVELARSKAAFDTDHGVTRSASWRLHGAHDRATHGLGPPPPRRRGAIGGCKPVPQPGTAAASCAADNRRMLASNALMHLALAQEPSLLKEKYVHHSCSLGLLVYKMSGSKDCLKLAGGVAG
eukprot:116109-Chlamydomonas_euryale.AAC.4